MKYEVGPPIVSGTPRATKDAEQNPSAVFVAHGMGQQVPFETIDTMARGICKQSGDKVTRMTSRTIRVDCETFQRLELEFSDRPPIHIYEGYWAPLTEGVIGIWEVIRFLVTGAVNGATSRLRLRRFLFGAIREFAIKLFDVVNLILAVLTVISIVITGATIIVIGTASLAFKKEEWIKAVLPDLTVIFELLLVVLVIGTFLTAILALWRTTRPLIAVVAVIGGAAFIGTAITIVLAFIVNEEPLFPANPICPIPHWVLWSHGWISTHGGSVQQTLHVALAAGLFGVSLMFARGAFQRFPLRVGRAVIAILTSLAILGLNLIGDCGDLLALATWLILLGMALFVRWFLIQFVGDVAIYVSSYQLDRFFAVRQEIKKAVWKAAHGVYAYSDERGDPAYKRVIVAGHSLGSVIAYDVLNRLMNEDDLVGGDVACCDDAPVKPWTCAAGRSCCSPSAHRSTRRRSSSPHTPRRPAPSARRWPRRFSRSSSVSVCSRG